MSNKYYLYRHIRLDKNEPFYIGIGTMYKRCTSLFTDISNGNTYYGVKEAANGIGIPEVTLNSYVYKGVKNKTNLRW